VVGKLSKFISEIPSKYNDPGNQVVTIEINGIYLSNNFIDMGERINFMTIGTMRTLQLNHLRPTQTLLELVDKSFISPAGSLDDVTITLDYWEYHVEFLVIHSKYSKPGHQFVLGRPWLAIVDAFISCRSREMTISNGNHNQKLVLFPLFQPTIEVTLWLENPYGEENCAQILLIVEKAKGVQEQNEEQILILFLANTECIEYPQSFPKFTHIFIPKFNEVWNPSTSKLITISTISGEEKSSFQIVEISLGKSLYINSSLKSDHQQKMI
jgi:hypothetical protein